MLPSGDCHKVRTLWHGAIRDAPLERTKCILSLFIYPYTVHQEAKNPVAFRYVRLVQKPVSRPV
jgi:hypothetical protein